ncbi:uncharacterized protein [Chelonus insularis]|uniref:uncharacterized protein n=1 Tax=Chelonus insularis TaxID=460826 RepID=UPI00158D498B|nr:uncharacterized protein LOC118074980 [Chelonus insularis]
MDDVLKQEWMIAIARTSISPNSYVCSDHFTNESYHQTNEYTTLKRLLSNAIRNIIKNPEVPLDSTITVAESTNKDDLNSQSGYSDIKIEINKRKKPYPFTFKDLTNKKFRFKNSVQTESIERKDFIYF